MISIEKKLPDGWKEFRIDELARIEIGKTPPRKNKHLFEGENIWLSIADLKHKTIFGKFAVRMEGTSEMQVLKQL